MKPQRIQLKRSSGFNLQAVSLALNGLAAVSCARGHNRKWGNPWKVGEWSGTLQRRMTRADAVLRFKTELLSAESGNFRRLRDLAKTELRGKNLGCFCPPSEPCHCDVWLEVANS